MVIMIIRGRTPTDHREHFAAGKTPDVVFRSVDLPDGTHVMISDEAQSKTTGSTRSPEELAAEKSDLLNPSPQCAGIGESIDGEETLLGQRAIRVLTAAPTGLSRRIVWAFPEFNCAVAQMIVQTKSDPNSPWQTTQGSRLTSFSAADPDPSLFTNWAGYDELKPSDVRRRLNVKHGITPQNCPQCFKGDPTDAAYLKQHAPPAQSTQP